ncbi:AAA family ATPase [Streptomyces sp. NPDC051173]|uniref:helix-turn-helix transcriptional regulator n=1 Tax=Streptomyces sp. NPDC051173 TaxID=3155164 RepID=UPI003450507D
MAVSSDRGRDASWRHLPGRSHALDGLLRTAAAARAGSARAVVVRGPAGIGRTALLAALAERLTSTGMTVRHRTARPGAREHQAVRDLFEPFDAGLPAATGAPAAYAVHRALHRRATGLLADGPLALILDDAQACDEASLNGLGFVLRRAASLPLLVILAQRTERPGPGADALSALLAHDGCTALDLGPLDPAATAAVVTRALGRPPAELFLQHCAELSGGNPGLLTRLLTDARAAGIRPDTDGLHRLRAVGEDLLTRSAKARLSAQAGPVRAVARAVAVLGHTDPELLGALSTVTGRRLTAALEALRRAGIVAPAGHPTVIREAVRRAVLAELPAPERETLRARAARLLNDAGRPACEVAAQLVHLKEPAEPWMPGVLRAAAAQAPDRTTARAAMRCLRRVLAAGPTGGLRQEIRVELARTSAPLAPATTLAQLRQALAEATRPHDRARIVVEYGLTAVGTRRAPQAVRELGAVLDTLPTEPGTPGHGLRTPVAAALLVTAVNDRTALAAARERARDWPVPRGDSRGERHLLASLSTLAAFDGGPADQAVDLARRALWIESPAPVGPCVLGASIVLALADEVDEAMEAFERCVSDSRARHEPWTHIAALCGQSLTLHGTGDVATAVTTARTAVDLAARAGCPGATMPALALATALLSQGDAEEADALLDSIAGPAVAQGVWEWHQFLYTKGRARRERGDLEGALELWLHCGRSLEAAGISNPVLAPWWLPATTTLVQQGRTRAAAELAERSQEAVRRWGTPRAIGLGLIAAGVVAEGKARLDLLGEAVDALAASPARLERAKAEYQLGCELLAHGATADARRHLRRTVELATGCGYHMLAARARKLLVAAGGRMSRLAVSPVDSLTESERRVAALARRGISNKEIAATLFLSLRTVEAHLTNVYRKLDVRGRADLPPSLDAPYRPRRHAADGPRRSPADTRAPSH